jgi:long-subunit acyl-CoA synthetase (AMP-forming)
MLSHYACVAQISQLNVTLPFDDNDVVLGVLPFFHVGFCTLCKLFVALWNDGHFELFTSSRSYDCLTTKIHS